ncbi:MAG: AbrB/MazE/SpoVT family DNA-binding domain-containing protein [Promicromonosporaceae bacterium]|nr:AbrB/MazE/SpoVT family DNA-binding domain-containing protein [Promicromonosporaceae bacterium]
MSLIVESAKVLPKGQVTLPKDIRRKLGVENGDRVVMVWDSDRVVMMNAAVYGMRILQREFEGVADRLGLETEDDVAALFTE